MKHLEPTPTFTHTAKELLSTGEKLVVLEAIEDDPWSGVVVEIDGEEFGGRTRFVQFALDGDKQSRRGHYLKVTYSIFNEGDYILLLHVGTESQWERWMRNKGARTVIAAALRGLLTGA